MDVADDVATPSRENVVATFVGATSHELGLHEATVPINADVTLTALAGTGSETTSELLALANTDETVLVAVARQDTTVPTSTTVAA